MLENTQLDYVQHLERGYCENHPDVIAGTKQQVVDRAVKQLLEALQANGFELDGNILKRGDGWLQYDTVSSKWQYSNDAGVNWQDMGSGGGGVPAEVGNPTTIGTMQIRDNGGTLELSGDGETWDEFYASGWDLNLQNNRLLPPLFEQETDPASTLTNGGCAVWKNTTTGEVWLLYKTQNSLVHRVNLSDYPCQIRLNPSSGLPEVNLWGEWGPLYAINFTSLADAFFVPPYVLSETQPDTSLPQTQDAGSLSVWKKQSTGQVWLMFNDGGTLKKVELT